MQRVRAPTVPEVDAGHAPVKHNLDHRFDVPHLPERQWCMYKQKGEELNQEK